MVKYFEARQHHVGVDETTLNLLILRGNSAKHGDVAAIIDQSNLLLFIAAFENAIHYINGQSRIKKLKEDSTLPKYLTAICYADFIKLVEDTQADIDDASRQWGISIDDLQLLLDAYNKL